MSSSIKSYKDGGKNKVESGVESIYVTVNVDNWSFYRITGHSIE